MNKRDMMRVELVRRAAWWLPFVFAAFVAARPSPAQTSGVPPLMSGDCTVSSTGSASCLSTNGVAFAPSATVDTTNAGNISSGTLNAARLPQTGIGTSTVSNATMTFDNTGRITSVNGVVRPSYTAAVFGDSYDYGLGSTVLRNGYAALLKKDTPTLAGWLGNFAVSGTTMPVIAQSVLANAVPNGSLPSTWFVGGGENDYTACGAGTSACQLLFTRAAMAAVYWGAVAPQQRTLGSNMTRSGSWAGNTSLAPLNALTGAAVGSAIQSATSGDSVTINIPAANNGSFRLFLYAPTGTAGGTFTLSNTTTGTNYTDACNGGSTTWNAFACNGTSAWAAGPWAVRLATQAGVANTIVLTHTNAASLTVIAYDYTTATPAVNTNAVVVRNAGAAYDVSGWTAAALATVVSQARSDGLTTVMLADARSALLALPDGGVSTTATSTYAGSTQPNHPRDGGHLAMEQAALQAQVLNSYVVSMTNAGVADADNFVDSRLLKWSTPYLCSGTWATCYRNLNNTDDYQTSGGVFYGPGGSGVLGWHIDGAPQGVAASGSFLGAYLGFFSKSNGYCFDTPAVVGNTVASNFTATFCVRPGDGASVQAGGHTAAGFVATASGSAGFHGVLFTPSSSSAACSAGDFADDANYHYVCVAANLWKRAALSGF